MVLLAILGWGWLSGGCDPGMTKPPEGLAVEPESANFGDVPVGGAARVDLELSNPGIDRIQILDVQVPEALLGEFRVDAVPAALLPGKTVMVAVVFSPMIEGARAADLVFVTDPGPSLRVPVTGHAVRSGLSIQPERLDFGAVPLGETQTATITLWNRGDQVREIRAVGLGPSTSPEFSAFLPGVQRLQPNARTSVLLRYAPQNAGFDAGRMVVVENSRSEPASVEVFGEGVADELTVQPPALVFEGVLVGDTKTRMLRVINRGPRGYALDAASITADVPTERTPFEIVTPIPLSVPAGEERALEIRYGPLQPAQEIFTLRLESEGFLEPLSLQLIGESTLAPAPRVQTDAQTIDFGTAQVGSSSPRNLWLENVGGTLLNIHELRVVPSDAPFEVSSAPAPSMQPLDRTVIPLRFSPNSAGQSKAALELHTDDPQTPVRTIALIGAGQLSPVANLWVQPRSLRLPSASSTVAASVVVRNVGTAPLPLAAQVSPAPPFAFATGSSSASVSLAPGAQARLSLRFAPRDLLLWSGQLRLSSPGIVDDHTIGLLGQARPPSGLAPSVSIALRWQSGTNLDLHLVREAGRFLDAPVDCCYCNQAPDWGRRGDILDDPVLLNDALSGPAEERLELSNAAEDRYSLYVHNAGSSPAQARVVLEGERVVPVSVSREVPPGARWFVGVLEREIEDSEVFQLRALGLPLDAPSAESCF